MQMTDKMFEPLDDYEKDLIDVIDKVAYEIVSLDEEKTRLLQAAAKKKLDSLKTMRSTLPE